MKKRKMGFTSKNELLKKAQREAIDNLEMNDLRYNLKDILSWVDKTDLPALRAFEKAYPGTIILNCQNIPVLKVQMKE